jgi:excisionase family DNA binding protein
MSISHPERLAPATGETPNSDPFMSIEQAARYLGVSDTFIRREVAHGDLPGVRFGRLLRIRQSALESYVAANTTGAA